MNSTRIDLKLVLDQADIPVELDTFSKRLNLQKRIYLIQVAGCDLGYHFGWYLRGPYSKTLTADAFTLRAELDTGEQDHVRHHLPTAAQERIRRARALWAQPTQGPHGITVRGDEWLELLASLHYLRHIAYWPRLANRDFEAVFAKLIEAKPQFTHTRFQAQRAWDRLAEFGLIQARTLP